jgi:hypothetical protein
MAMNDPLLRVATPHPCNTQQTPLECATECATGVQQPSLKALAMLAIGWTTLRNTHTTTPEKTRNKPPPFAPPFVAQFSSTEPSNSAGSEGDDHYLLRVAQVRECNTQQSTYGTGRDTYGKPLQPLVTCGECSHFTRNRDNPTVGCGACKLGEPDLGGWPYFPGARRCCESYNAIEAQA